MDFCLLSCENKKKIKRKQNPLIQMMVSEERKSTTNPAMLLNIQNESAINPDGHPHEFLISRGATLSTFNRITSSSE